MSYDNCIVPKENFFPNTQFELNIYKQTMKITSSTIYCRGLVIFYVVKTILSGVRKIFHGLVQKNLIIAYADKKVDIIKAQHQKLCLTQNNYKIK